MAEPVAEAALLVSPAPFDGAADGSVEVVQAARPRAITEARATTGRRRRMSLPFISCYGQLSPGVRVFRTLGDIQLS